MYRRIALTEAGNSRSWNERYKIVHLAPFSISIRNSRIIKITMIEVNEEFHVETGRY